MKNIDAENKENNQTKIFGIHLLNGVVQVDLVQKLGLMAGSTFFIPIFVSKKIIIWYLMIHKMVMSNKVDTVEGLIRILQMMLEVLIVQIFQQELQKHQ